MADKNIQMTQRNATNDAWDNLYPVTKAVNIIQDSNNRFVSDAEKTAWNAKETPAGAQAKADAVQANLNTHIADYIRQPGYATASGSANTYAVTLNPAPTSYTEGMCVAVKINVDNTGASTVNVNGLGAKAIKKSDGTDVAAGELKAGSIYTMRYNGTNFILQGERGFVASVGNWLIYNDTQLSSTFSTTPVKLKAVKIKYPGSYRVSFTINSPGLVTTYGQIYVNGVAVSGTLNAAYNGDLTAGCDITNLKKDDELQIYAWTSGSSASSVMNFKVYIQDLLTIILT